MDRGRQFRTGAKLGQILAFGYNANADLAKAGANRFRGGGHGHDLDFAVLGVSRGPQRGREGEVGGAAHGRSGWRRTRSWLTTGARPRLEAHDDLDRPVEAVEQVSEGTQPVAAIICTGAQVAQGPGSEPHGRRLRWRGRRRGRPPLEAERGQVSP